MLHEDNLTRYQQQGLLFVISAPSGAGKTSLLKSIVDENRHFSVAVSHTSRPPRAQEMEAVNYYFISESSFEDLIQVGSFVEYAKVHGNYYGTSKKEIQQKQGKGQHVILEIDVQGATQIKTQYPDVILIFICPPSIRALRERLEQRKTDSSHMIDARIHHAKLELEQSINFDYVLVNDDFHTAKHDLQCIFRAEELVSHRNQDILDNILIN